MVPSILIVEDEPAIAIDIAFNLESSGYTVAGVAHDGEKALELLTTKEPDLVMLDINLGNSELDGIDVAKVIDSQYGIPFIFLSSYSDQDTIAKASTTFPAAYLVKPFKETDLYPAVQMALARKKGESNSRVPTLSLLNKNLLSSITDSEYHVIECIWSGMSNSEIADKLFISKNTVKTHIRNIYTKMDVNNRTGLLKLIREYK